MGSEQINEKIKGLNISDFTRDVYKEFYWACNKFPSPDGVMTALTEEVGEVAKAMLDESRPKIWKEAVQAAAMLARVAIEGDPLLDTVRKTRSTQDFIPGEKICTYPGCEDRLRKTPPCALCTPYTKKS